MTFTDLFYIVMTSIAAATIYYAARGAHAAHQRLDLHNKIIEKMLKSTLEMDETRKIVIKNLKKISNALGLDDDPEGG